MGNYSNTQQQAYIAYEQPDTFYRIIFNSALAQQAMKMLSLTAFVGISIPPSVTYCVGTMQTMIT